MFMSLAAGISATSVPTITNPVMMPAVGRLAPRACALAGIIGSRLPSAIPNNSEGVNTGKPKLDILKSLVFAGT
jgi:hypothetical protein